MVCDRCKTAVQSIFEDSGHKTLSVDLGVIEIERKLSKQEIQELNTSLQTISFSFMDDEKSRLIEQIKSLIIQLVHKEKLELKTNLSNFLSDKLNNDYGYLSNLFSTVEGTTIEKYFIKHKIERVKELIVYDELSLSEIAFQLNYSSVAHLSNQFKKVTGLTPTHFKKLKESKRKSLDNL